jgi:alpha-1,3-mannosyltransferase
LIAPAGLGGLSVVHVVRQFAPSVGGLEDAVLNLARQQARRGLAPRVVTLDRLFTDRRHVLPEHDNVSGIPVRRLPWKGSSRYPLAPSVLAEIAHADLVHVHGIDFFFDYLAAARPWHRRPMVASTHGGFFHTQFGAGLKRIWFRNITKASARAYGAVIACSENDAAVFAMLDLPYLTTIENGIDLAKFVQPGGQARARHRIVTFGRFAAHKRIAALFDILARLLKQENDWFLVVAGSPADQDVASLRQAAESAGVAGHVRFHLAPTDAEIASELAGATWFACASAHEGFGLAAVEAASAGLIPLLSDIPPFQRLVRRLGDGVIFDPASPLAAAEAIRASAERGMLAMRGDAVQVAAQAYDWRGAADRHLDVYADVLARAGQRAAA